MNQKVIGPLTTVVVVGVMLYVGINHRQTLSADRLFIGGLAIVASLMMTIRAYQS